jgi:hypothetical protein
MCSHPQQTTRHASPSAAAHNTSLVVHVAAVAMDDRSLDHAYCRLTEPARYHRSAVLLSLNVCLHQVLHVPRKFVEYIDHMSNVLAAGFEFISKSVVLLYNLLIINAVYLQIRRHTRLLMDGLWDIYKTEYLDSQSKRSEICICTGRMGEPNIWIIWCVCLNFSIYGFPWRNCSYSSHATTWLTEGDTVVN